VGIPPLQLPFVPYLTGRHYFYLVWAVVVLLFFICERIVHSRMGRALVAVRDKEKAASAVGVDVAGAKLTVFVLSAVFAALAGFLYAHQITFISPGSFGFMVSIRIVVMVVIGGMASIYGSVLGAIVLTMLSEYLHVFSEWEMVVYGLILMTVTIFLPQGLVRGILDIYERSKRQRYASAASES
jgi:branched-chain amino acid transport system permease protein